MHALSAAAAGDVRPAPSHSAQRMQTSTFREQQGAAGAGSGGGEEAESRGVAGVVEGVVGEAYAGDGPGLADLGGYDGGAQGAFWRSFCGF